VFPLPLALLLLLAAPAQASPHVSTGAVTPVDRLYLERLGEALVLSRATSGKIWPEWGLEKTPILIYEAGRVAYLVNHPAPPPDFPRLDLKIPLLGAVHAKFGRDPRFSANTSVMLGEVPTACVGYTSSASESETPSLRFIALVFHEAFHALQAKAGKPGKGMVEGILLRYPDLDAENLALAQIEQMILHQLVRFDDVPDPDRVRAFLAVREARRRLLGNEFLHGERGIEYQEGIPTYVEVRVLEEAKKAAAGMPGFGAEDPYSLGFSLAPEIRAAHFYGRLLRFTSDAGSFRERAYGTGMALALVLDRLGAEWKPAVFGSDKYLDEILAEKVPLPPDASAALLARVRTEYGFPGILRVVQEKVGAIREERRLALEKFQRQEGLRITVKAPPGLPVEIRGFDPLNIQKIDASNAIHRRILELAFGESRFQASGIPSLVSLGDGPFDIRGVSVFVPRDEVEIEADFLPVGLEPGERSFRGSLRLTAPGLTIRAATGSLTVSSDGAGLEIAPAR
jgi:hypothetical protein